MLCSDLPEISTKTKTALKDIFIFTNGEGKPGVVTHTYNPSTRGVDKKDFEVKTSLTNAMRSCPNKYKKRKPMVLQHDNYWTMTGHKFKLGCICLQSECCTLCWIAEPRIRWSGGTCSNSDHTSLSRVCCCLVGFFFFYLCSFLQSGEVFFMASTFPRVIGDGYGIYPCPLETH